MKRLLVAVLPTLLVALAGCRREGNLRNRPGWRRHHDLQ
jgi:hypothetical protein